MQDPSSLYTQMNAQVHHQQQQQQQHPQAQAQFPEQEHLKCPRCDSANTKFCYYNNYNLSQPRHFCKSCRRYWTKGGSLRNIPVGGGSRKNAKRSSSSATAADVSPSSAASAPKRPASAPPPPPDKSKGDDEGGEVSDKMPVKGDNFEGQFGDFLGAASGSSFSSLLGSTEGQYSNFMDGPSGLPDQFGDTGSGQNMDPSGGGSSNNNNGDGFLNGWPDLSMYTPGSSFL